MALVAHLSKGMPETPWAQWGPRSNPGLVVPMVRTSSDPGVGDGPERCKRLPPTGFRSHEGKAMSYA